MDLNPFSDIPYDVQSLLASAMTLPLHEASLPGWRWAMLIRRLVAVL